MAKILTVAECREDGFDQIGRGVAHVLAVVEHQQPDPALQRGGHRLAHALARLLGDAQHRGDRVGHRRRIGDRGQFEKPDAVGKFIGEPRRDLGCQAGLADPAHPGQRDQPMCSQRRLHLGDLGLAPDEAGGLQVAGSPDSHPAPATAESPSADPALGPETPPPGLASPATGAAPDRPDRPR